MPLLILPIEQAIEILRLIPNSLYRDDLRERILDTSVGPCRECGCIVRHRPEPPCPFFREEIAYTAVQYRHTKEGAKL